MNGLLDGRAVIVTGISSGIGRRLESPVRPKALASQASISTRRVASKAVEEIMRVGGLAGFVPVDVSEPQQVRTVFARLDHAADGLVNCGAAL